VTQPGRMYHMKKLCAISLAALLVGSFAAEEEEDSKSKKDSVGTVIGIDLGTTYSWLVLVNTFQNVFYVIYGIIIHDYTLLIHMF